jgi:hypothetical protein
MNKKIFLLCLYIIKMSQLEVSKNVIYSVPFVLVTGKLAPAQVANFNGSSKLLSIVRTIVGGTAGVPATAVVAPTAPAGGAVYLLGLYSSNALDTSTYTVFWTNQYSQSQQFIAGSVSTLGAGVQYAP